MPESLFTRVRWREGYDIADVDAFIERLTATIEGRSIDQPVTVDDIRNVIFTPVRFREGYDVQEVDTFLDLAVQSLQGGQPPVETRPAPRPQRDSPTFTLVRMQEGYDPLDVDEFVDRVMATVNGQPVDRPVTAREIRTIQFSTVRIREGYEVQEVDLFLDEAEGWLRDS